MNYLSIIINGLPLLVTFGIALSFQMANEMQIPKKKRVPPASWPWLTTKGKKYVITYTLLFTLSFSGIIYSEYEKSLLEQRPPTTTHKEQPVKELFQPSQIEKTTNVFKEETEVPILDLSILKDSDNPVLVSDIQNDSLSLYFTFTVVNDGVAFDIRDKVMTFNIQNHKLTKVNYMKSSAFTEDIKLYKGLDRGIVAGIKAESTSVMADTFYLYVKIRYKDIKLREQPPLRKIYFLTGFRNYKVATDVKGIFEPKNTQEYEELKRLLVDNSFW